MCNRNNLNVKAEDGVLTIESDSDASTYMPQVKADFNGDGWEDLLLFQDIQQNSWVAMT